MEIADYLAAVRRRLWLLVLAPLVSAAAAVAYGLLSPTMYTAQTTISSSSLVGTPYSQFTGPQAIGQFVSTFAASTSGPAVVAQTAEDTGVSRAELVDNVSVSQVGASSNVTVTYTGPDEGQAGEVAEALATNALENMYSGQVEVADQRVASAEESLAAANKALSDYTEEVGVGDPSAAYQAALSQVAALQQAQAMYASTGDSDAAREMEGFVNSTQTRASELGTTLPKYQALQFSLSLATTSYQSELADQRSIKAQAAAAAAPGVIASQEVTSDKSNTTIAKLAVTAFGAALLLTSMLIVVLEFVAALRRQGPLSGHHR